MDEDDEIIQIGNDSVERRSDDILFKYGLIYYPEIKILRCLECDSVLSCGFVHHFRRFHPSMKISRPDEEYIKYNFINDESPYRNFTQVPLPPLQFLPIVSALACSVCAFCCVDKHHMNRHIRSHSEGTSFFICSAQTLSKGSYKTYFRVIDVSDVNEIDVDYMFLNLDLIKTNNTLSG